MPKAKNQTPENNSPFDRSGSGLRAALLFTVVAFLTIALVVVWKQLPKDAAPKPVPIVQTNQEKTSCRDRGWIWVECGKPACKPGEACDQVCVPQCMPPTWQPTRTEPAPSPTPIRERPAGMSCDDLNFICVDPAFSKNTLTSPFVVNGTGIAFESHINWRLLDGNGDVLESGFTLANAPEAGTAGPFEIRAFILTVPKTNTGTLEVLEYSAKDGSPIHVVKIPVRLPQTNMSVKIYFTPYEVGNDCSKVVENTQSVVRTSLPIEATLRKLLNPELGPGANTAIRDVELRSIKVSGGTATVVFSPELENYGGGSCNVQAIRSQIENTLKQFASVRNVIISVEGKTPEETLQP